MTTKPESRRQRRIQKALRKRFPKIWLFKTWGGPFQPSGLPDLLGCFNGHFFSFEVKEPGEEPSEIQLETIADIQKAGGIATVIETAEEAISTLEAIRRLPKGRSHILSGKKR
jgi:hypothetical protein